MMLNLTLLICFLIILVVTFLVMVKPLFLSSPAPYFDVKEEQADFDPSVSLLETITELETDYKMGKLSREDFEALTLEYQRNYLERKKSE